MKNRFNKMLLTAGVLLAGASTQVQASYGTNITNIADDASTLFTAVFAVAVTIVASRIGLWVVRKIKS